MNGMTRAAGYSETIQFIKWLHMCCCKTLRSSELIILVRLVKDIFIVENDC